MNLKPDWHYIKAIAAIRLAQNRTERHIWPEDISAGNKKHEYLVGEVTDLEMMGVAGEFMVRRLFGESEDLHTRFDDGVDIRHLALDIDVKTTRWEQQLEGRFLQWRETKPINCDVVVMCALSLKFKHGLILGYATAREVMNAPVNKARRWPCHEIHIDDLHPIWHLQVPNVARDIKATARPE